MNKNRMKTLTAIILIIAVGIGLLPGMTMTAYGVGETWTSRTSGTTNNLNGVCTAEVSL